MTSRADRRPPRGATGPPPASAIHQGAHDEAAPLCERAHASERSLQAARARVATTLKYLGAIYSQRGKLDAAEKVYVRAVRLSEETVGPDDPETAKHVGNLGSLHLRRGDRDAARAMLDRALRIWEAQAKPDPTSVRPQAAM